jgi:hypothetical protein
MIEVSQASTPLHVRLQSNPAGQVIVRSLQSPAAHSMLQVVPVQVVHSDGQAPPGATGADGHALFPVSIDASDDPLPPASDPSPPPPLSLPHAARTTAAHRTFRMT